MKRSDPHSYPQIAVVIVTFNNFPIISSCLAALKSALRNISSQVIVVDNLSTDGTRQSLRKAQSVLGENVPFDLILNPENKGFTRAINQGLQKVKADFVLLLNPDVLLQDETLPVLFACFEQNRTGVVAPQMRYLQGEVQASCRRFPRLRDVFYTAVGLSRLFPANAEFNRWKMGDFDHRSSRVVDQPQGAFLLFPTAVLHKVGLWDESFWLFFSDVDWCRRVITSGMQIYFCADTFVLHKKGDSIYRNRLYAVISSHRSFVHYFDKTVTTSIERFGTRIVHLFLLTVCWWRLLLISIAVDRKR